MLKSECVGLGFEERLKRETADRACWMEGNVSIRYQRHGEIYIPARILGTQGTQLSFGSIRSYLHDIAAFRHAMVAVQWRCVN